MKFMKFNQDSSSVLDLNQSGDPGNLPFCLINTIHKIEERSCLCLLQIVKKYLIIAAILFSQACFAVGKNELHLVSTLPCMNLHTKHRIGNQHRWSQRLSSYRAGRITRIQPLKNGIALEVLSVLRNQEGLDITSIVIGQKKY
jgi:hypothetical protein